MNSSAETLMPLEQHPYNKIEIPADTRLLIVGTAPPPRFSLPRPPFGQLKKGKDADFFYGSVSNYLWQYLKLAAGEPDFAKPGTKEACDENTEDMMRDYLIKHHMWMRDVLQTYSRKEGEGDSAEDRHIDIDNARTTFLDFRAVLDLGKKIDRVVFTSVATSDWFFRRALPAHCNAEQAQSYRALFQSADAKRRSRCEQGIVDEFCRAYFDGRLVRFHVAASPSPSAGASTKQKFIDIYRRILFEQV